MEIPLNLARMLHKQPIMAPTSRNRLACDQADRYTVQPPRRFSLSLRAAASDLAAAGARLQKAPS
jgi:hypothetical protein